MTGTGRVGWDGPDAIWRESPRGGAWDPASIGMAGLDRLRALVRGEMPVPPIEYLTGIVPVEAGVGTMTMAMPATDWLAGGEPRFYFGGVFALLADACLAGAIISGLPEGVALTTQEMTLHFLRPGSPESGRLTGRGRIIHGGCQIGLSEVNIHDSDGRLLTYGTSRCVTVKVPVPDAMSAPVPDQPEPTWVPPLQRPIQGEFTPIDVVTGSHGRELVQAWSDGSLPMAPLSHLFGMHLVSGGDGIARAEMPATGWLTNPAGTVYGGALAMLADYAMNFAVYSTVPAGHSSRSLDLKVNFLRPATPDGRSLSAYGQVIHAGRRMAVASGEVLDADGKQLVVATASHMLSSEPFKF